MSRPAAAGAVAALAAALALAAPPPATGEIRFREVASAWGVDFRHHHCGSGEFYMIETMGSGVVILDYDGDGDGDLFFVDSGLLPGYQGEPPRSVLYRNDGGRFVDVTDRAGIRVAAYGMGATAGDVDGDGDPDLYVTAFGPNQLFRNQGDGTFVDVTAAAGVGDPLWGTSATFADLDRDGDLDLYVANYVDFSFDNNQLCGLPAKRLRSYCHPDVYDGQPDRYFRNRGDGTFEDATAAAGFGEAGGKGLGVVSGDIDGDGRPDLYVANDMTANYLFKNLGDGSFEEVALMAGTAYSEGGNPEAGMGVELGDLDGDGLPEIMVTHLDQQTNAVYGNLGSWLFIDRRYTSQLAEASVYKVGFGLAFADLDQDADLDVVVANGHIIHNIELWERGTTYKQTNQAFENVGGGRFREVPAAGLTGVYSSRGLALGDLDGDGDLELVVSNSDDPAELYENVGSGLGRWLQIDLLAPGGNVAGIGAKLELEAGSRRQTREVRTASSYLSQSATTAHFGLGGEPAARRLTVRWLDGGVLRIGELPADRRLRIAPPRR